MLRGRFFQHRSFPSDSREPPMNVTLALALMSACVINMACLFGHL
jgi:hypothetical protein